MSDTSELRTWRNVAVALVPVHLLLTALTLGLRVEHFLLDAALLGLVLAGPRSRRLALVLFPMWLVGVLYDNVRLLADFRADVHVADVFLTELELFGVSTAEGIVSPSQFFATVNSAFFDLVCGLAYILYIYEVPAVLIAFVVIKDRERAYRLGWAFFLLNVAGLLTQLVYPVAPPWYVELYGMGPAVLDAAPSAAGGLRFDELTGFGYFAAMYTRNSNVFGAMPSLHMAYAVVVFSACATRGWRWAIPTALFAALVGFSAIYLQHHYVLDVLVGVVYGVAAYLAIVAFFATMRRPTPPPTEVHHAGPDYLSE